MEELRTRVAESESREWDAKAELEKASAGLASSQALVTETRSKEAARDEGAGRAADAAGGGGS